MNRKETPMGFKVQNRGKQDGNSLEGSTRGRVLCRFNSRRNVYRLRFNGVHPDQREMILLALEVARERANTQYDVVALEAMALEFLATYPSAERPKVTSVNTCAISGTPLAAVPAVHTGAEPEQQKKATPVSKVSKKQRARPGHPKRRRPEMCPEMNERLRSLKSEEQWQEERRKLGYEKVNGKIRLLR
jgi:hypothetical protein